MEDVLHFVESFATYVFKGVLSDQLQVMWAHLTRAVLHYFRPVRYTTREDFLVAARAARDSLTQYATLAEQYRFPDKTFSVNMHISICRLYEQEVARGAAAADNEFIVERMMQEFKRTAGRRVAWKVEEHFAQQHLLHRAMTDIRYQYPNLKDLDEMLGRARMDLTDPKFDPPNPEGMWLKGEGFPAALARPGAGRAEYILTAAKKTAKYQEDPTGFHLWCET
ncbi:hypothetical protein GPECTOR_657g778 [Gonium pectorale]|uniref:Uncharacterized protein n=1 Tax=Gonium pectorale TaxID=33097 RepID=A0A150FVZ5_GONPE|nr:hypothetical protein GPECTOR_657g778 [Gonium pectorale]|eukprot:KXZ41200.1 hypothetical protein GPECTOR_657g778 [Gonium pectorale]